MDYSPAGSFVHEILQARTLQWVAVHSSRKLSQPRDQTQSPAVWAMQESQVQSLGQEEPLEKEMTTNSSILDWEIPWTEEPGGL